MTVFSLFIRTIWLFYGFITVQGTHNGLYDGGGGCGGGCGVVLSWGGGLGITWMSYPNRNLPKPLQTPKHPIHNHPQYPVLHEQTPFILSCKNLVCCQCYCMFQKNKSCVNTFYAVIDVLGCLRKCSWIMNAELCICEVHYPLFPRIVPNRLSNNSWLLNLGHPRGCMSAIYTIKKWSPPLMN